MHDQMNEQIQPGTVIEDGVSFEDFVRRYEGQRAEWRAGKVVRQGTNNPQHNLIQRFLVRLFSWYLDLHEMGIVVPAGVPMYRSASVPAREPDIIVLLGDHISRIGETHVEGGGDLVVEIVSPGSGSTDRGVKFDEYEEAGIPEYWIIDPVRKQVDVYALNDGLYQREKSQDDRIRSRVLPGFVLDSALLWRNPLPSSREIVQLAESMQRR